MGWWVPRELPDMRKECQHDHFRFAVFIRQWQSGSLDNITTHYGEKEVTLPQVLIYDCTNDWGWTGEEIQNDGGASKAWCCCHNPHGTRSVTKWFGWLQRCTGAVPNRTVVHVEPGVYFHIQLRTPEVTFGPCWAEAPRGHELRNRL